MQNIQQELRQFVVDNFLFGQDEGRLAADTSFMEGGIVDSTGVLELVGFVEEQYGIKIEDEELTPENLDSLERLSRFISSKL